METCFTFYLSKMYCVASVTPSPNCTVQKWVGDLQFGTGGCVSLAWDSGLMPKTLSALS